MMTVLPKHKDVDMILDSGVYQRIAMLPGYDEKEEIMIHYTVTEQCPFNCRGCINALTAGVDQAERNAFIPREKTDEELKRDAAAAAQLIRQSGKHEAVIVYYGGEPMLRLDRMERFCKQLSSTLGEDHRIRYMVVTSGHYLEKAIRKYPRLTADIWLTAVSIDGNSKQHDDMRRGTSLATIRRQVGALDRVRNGDVLVWSTMRPGMSLLDCFSSYMYFRERGQAEHFFWHWDEAQGEISDLGTHLGRYFADLEVVMGHYITHLRRQDMLSIIHINDLVLYLLTQKRRGSTACGVERMANFDIIGDGKIHACADLPETMNIGTISESGAVLFDEAAQERLDQLITYKDQLGCAACGVEPYCGGRCPVQIYTGGIERARQYCYMMRGHVRTVKQYITEIIEFLVRDETPLQKLYQSAYLCKFTDVTP
jgi:radical SAM protein with 4Fe4S-binding SPASM domain